jgi:hypothetical protein
MQAKVIECRGCGRMFKSDGHKLCGRCRYAKPPGLRAEKRVCPICAAEKSGKADYCARCFSREMSIARDRLKAQADSRLSKRLVRESQRNTPRLYSRPTPSNKPKAAGWVNPHGYVIRADGFAYIPDA